jgi:hypothetical protein
MDNDSSPIKVKVIIEFLETIEREADVYLDHDGWEGRDKTEMLKNVFVHRPVSKFNDDPYLMINN